MSVDVLLDTAPVATYTSLVAPMWHEALGIPLAALDGWTAGSAVPLLEAGVADMDGRPGWYRRWEPSNGVGSWEGATGFLREVLAQARKRPDGVLRIVEVSRWDGKGVR